MPAGGDGAALRCPARSPQTLERLQDPRRRDRAPRAHRRDRGWPRPRSRAPCRSWSARPTLSLPLAGVIDLAAERARLQRELDRIDKEIAKIDAKLGNAQFIAKATEEVVEEQRERREEASALRGKVEAALARLASS